MISSILKVIPKLDTAALRKMEQTMQQRFTRIAKRFGAGLAKSLKSGAVLGAAVALVDKLLNPLKAADEALASTLTKGSDIQTYANMFGTDAGRLTKLLALGKATGLESQNVYDLLGKYQQQIAQAQANPNEPHLLSQFANDSDLADSFFSFIQSIQKLDKNQQALIQQQVFGEKQVLRMASFLQQDFADLYKNVGLDQITAEQIAQAVSHVDKMGAYNDALTANREMQDLVAKAKIITPSMIKMRDKAERAALERENKQLRSYEDLSHLRETADKVLDLLTWLMTSLGSFIPFVTAKINLIIGYLEKFTKAPFFRGIFKWGKGD